MFVRVGITLKYLLTWAAGAFGDTGSSTDASVGYFELGHLECDGDSK